MRRLSVYCLLLLLWLVSCGLSQEDILKREEYMNRAKDYYRKQKYPQALQQINLALVLDPSCKRCLVSQGWTYFFLKKYDNAEESFNKALKLDSSDPWCHYGAGTIAFKRANRVEARLLKLDEKISKNSNLAEQFAKDIERLQKERETLYESSLKSFQNALRVASDNYNIYKMVGLVYAAKGLDYSKDAISYLDKFLRVMDDNLTTTSRDIDNREKQRLQPGLAQKDRERLDMELENLNSALTEYQQEYCRAQGLASDLIFQLAYQESQKIVNTVSPDEKQGHNEKMREYTREVKQRIQAMLKVSPNLVNQYRNLSTLAKLEGDYELAAQYLKEYIQEHPLQDAKLRAEAKLELERLKEKLRPEQNEPASENSESRE